MSSASCEVIVFALIDDSEMRVATVRAAREYFVVHCIQCVGCCEVAGGAMRATKQTSLSLDYRLSGSDKVVAWGWAVAAIAPPVMPAQAGIQQSKPLRPAFAEAAEQ